jgi:octaprenyl-diphosphate synthase
VAVVVKFGTEPGKGSRAGIERLHALCSDDLNKVNEVILRRMRSSVELIPQLAGHIIAAAKVSIGRMCSHRGERHIALAAAVEFIHTATLLHDDVVDDSALRRGRATANAVWGNKASVLVGDFLFSRAFQLMVEDGSLSVLDILSRASATIAEGEVQQLVTANDTATSEQAYLEVIRCKTAALFASACRIGAVVAARPRVEEEALESYGLNLGIAFQLVDDVLDYSAAQATLGKTVGDDFQDGKITLPVILAFRRGDDEERNFWRRTLEDMKQDETDLASAIALMERHGSLRDTVERARHYGSIARDALGIFTDGPEKAALLEVIDFCIDRAY